MRDPFFDSLKFYLICVVVLIHTIATYNYSIATYGVDFFLQLFAMPLFTFVSGYFFYAKSKTKLFKSILRLIESLLVYQLIFILFYLLLGRSFQTSWFYTPIWSLWYILSLAFWKILTYAVQHVNKWLVLSLSLVVALCIGFLPFDKELSIQRTFVFYPFFLLGYYFKDSEWIKRIFFAKNKIVSLFLLLVFLVLSILFVGSDLQYMFSCSVSYYRFPCGLLEAVLTRMLYMILAFIVSALFLSFIKPFKLTSELGQQTMKYYLFHPYIVIVLGIIIDKFTLPKSIPAVLIYTVVILAVITLFNKTSISSFVVNPISSLLGQSNKIESRS